MACGILGLDLVDGRGVRDDLRVHPCLADPPRDQLRVLGAEVDHQNGPRVIDVSTGSV